MSNKESTIFAFLLSYVEITCTRKAYHQLQKLKDDEGQLFITECYCQAQVCLEEDIDIIASQSIR